MWDGGQSKAHTLALLLGRTPTRAGQGLHRCGAWSPFQKNPHPHGAEAYRTAVASISTRAPLGRAATATQERAGGSEPKVSA